MDKRQKKKFKQKCYYKKWSWTNRKRKAKYAKEVIDIILPPGDGTPLWQRRLAYKMFLNNL